MSRSHRHTPIFGNCADSERQFKAYEHRRERRAVKAVLDEDGDYPAPKAFGSPWAGPKDGKTFWRGAEAKDMRK